MDNNKKIVKALLEKNYVDAKECVFNALYAKASLLLDEERVGIAAELFSEDKAMGMYSHDQDEEAKKNKKKSKEEKPSMYEETEEVAEEVVEEEAELEEDIQTPERAAEMRTKIGTAVKQTASAKDKLRYGKKSPHDPVKDRNYRAFKTAQGKRERVIGQDTAERASQKTYGLGGKVVKKAAKN